MTCGGDCEQLGAFGSAHIWIRGYKVSRPTAPSHMKIKITNMTCSILTRDTGLF